MSQLRPKEMVVLSGKGGTGKTTIAAALAILMGRRHGGLVACDCDVDAANLALLLPPRQTQCQIFHGGLAAHIDGDACLACGRCVEHCGFGALTGSPPKVDEMACEGCGVCALVCPHGAVTLADRLTGWVCSSTTPAGAVTLIHADLELGQGNSGRLVAEVRSRARQAAVSAGIELILSDGPPGLGCPVISTLTGADFALLVTEPSLSAIHDLQRTIRLCGQFGVQYGVIINKADLAPPETLHRIHTAVAEQGGQVVGEVPFDEAAAEACSRAVPLIAAHCGQTPAVVAIEHISHQLLATLELQE